MESNNNLGPNEVLVLISYPEGYEGKRHHKDGETYPMSIETANLLVKRGIATIQGESSIGETAEVAETPLTDEEIQDVIDEVEVTDETVEESTIEQVTEEANCRPDEVVKESLTAETSSKKKNKK